MEFPSQAFSNLPKLDLLEMADNGMEEASFDNLPASLRMM